jgi:uncharacterized spore protein YtfJ
MDIDTILTRASDSLTVSRVYGTPIERDGALIIPAAAVRGGGGGGDGRGIDPRGNGEGSGSGGGYGVDARPVGAFVVRDGSVQWVPAIDVARIARTLAGVLITALVVRSSVAWARSYARAHGA